MQLECRSLLRYLDSFFHTKLRYLGLLYTSCTFRLDRLHFRIPSTQQSCVWSAAAVPDSIVWQGLLMPSHRCLANVYIARVYILLLMCVTRTCSSKNFLGPVCLSELEKEWTWDIGGLSWLNHLPSVQVLIPGFCDGDLHRAPCSSLSSAPPTPRVLSRSLK